jgi:hypothetical protein
MQGLIRAHPKVTQNMARKKKKKRKEKMQRQI